MNVLVPLMVVMPIVGAGLTMALWQHVKLQQALGVVVLAANVVVAAVVLIDVADSGPVAVHIGGWPAPIGITLVADVLAMMLLLVALITLLAVFVYAIGQPRADKGAFYFHPLYLVLATGVCAAFLTGDLFNLFVAFEIMLVSSYVLITLGGRREQVRTGITYVVINLVASTLLVTTIGLIYAATGSVNMADVAVRFAEVPDAVQTTLGALLLVTFGIKAAIFPLFFWLPDSYPTAPAPVTAVFAGLLTKIGVYAILRTQTLFFHDGGTSMLILVLAALTMVIGVLGAIAQDDVKRILSFHIVSQIGYMLFGLSLFTVSGVAAAIFFVVHQIPVKTALFLVSGLIESVTGTAALTRLGGLIRRAPVTAALFGLAALSLAGIPPFSGFFGKLTLVSAGLDSGAWLVTGISLAVSVLTLYSMTKIWANAFWGPAMLPEVIETPHGALPRTAPRLMTASTAGLVAVALAIGIFAGPIWELSEQAAENLLAPGDAYIRAVLGP